MIDTNMFIQELESNITQYRSNDVKELVDNIDPAVFKVNEAKKVLGILRRKRYFKEMETAANIFIRAGQDEPIFSRHLAQVLIEQNDIAKALSILEPLSNEVTENYIEGPEVRGLIGRSYKQLFVNEGEETNLQKAIDAYLPDWKLRRDGCRWQGINVAALAYRAERDGISVNEDINYKIIAQEILTDIEDRGISGVWDYATGMEASIALGDWTASINWAGKYVKHPDVDAFELASTLRQLREIWQLEGTRGGGQLLPILEYALSQQEGATFEPLSSLPQDASTGFETVYGPEGVVYMQWLDTLHQKCLAVARILDNATGQPFGTGFLVKGSNLRKEWNDEPVLVTNAHVCSINPQDEAPLRPETAAAEFTRLPGRPKVNLGKLLHTSARNNLDASILSILPPAGVTFLDPIPYPPIKPHSKDSQQRIYVVGHPNGNDLAISMYDNSLVNYVPPYVHYRSPTEAGNSGSPVFNRQWGLFAIHHRALQNEQVNQGVLFYEISNALKK